MDENNKTPLEPTDEIQSESTDETQPESTDEPKKGSKIKPFLFFLLLNALIAFWGYKRIADYETESGMALILAAIGFFIIELICIFPAKKPTPSADNTTSSSAGDRETLFFVISLVLIIIAIVLFFKSCDFSGSKNSYDTYLDYNGNGKADKGEYAYHVNGNGDIDFWY